MGPDIKAEDKYMHSVLYMSRSDKTSYEDMFYCIKLLPLFTNFASLPDFKEIIEGQ